jgi:Protein of unknown function (DUF998)
MTTLPFSSRALASAALACLAAFPVLVIALHVIQRASYHPMSEAISELADGRDGWLMAVAFTAAGTGVLALAIVLRRLTPLRAVPALLAVASALTYASAIFRADGENARTTLHGTIHQAAGITMFVLIVITMFLAARGFRRAPGWERLARPTLVWASAAFAAFFLVPGLPPGDFGVAQRIFITAWFTWTLAVTAHARRAAAVEASERPALDPVLQA